MDPTEEGDLNDRARDPYDHWVVRFPGLHRALRAHKFAVAALCVVLVAALIAPVALSLLSRRGPSDPSAAAAPATTTTTTAPPTTTTAKPATTTTTTTTPSTGTTRTTTTTQPSAVNAYPDTYLTNAALQPAASAATAAAAGLPAAAAAPPPTPSNVATAPPLKAHEMFGFAPYWTLAKQSGFNVEGITTIAYYSVGVNPNGSLNETGPGWTGYLSQNFADLVTRAHDAGHRVVLTVSDFDAGQLDQLTSSTTAAGTLATALTYVLVYRHLDGVNFDLEPQGPTDRAGLTNLVTRISGLLKEVDPHYQVTIDTPADAASVSNGPYDLASLARAVDAFFVMDYAPNVSGTPSSTSPLTSTLPSDQATVQAYTAKVPAAKVILGLPAFGVDWPTTNGTLTAQATGPATATTLGDLLSSSDPRYWDGTTESGWTSYQVGAQWHETFFESPTSFFLAEHLAANDGLAGVGVWALGLDANDPADLWTLLGFAPAVQRGPPGPSSTSKSPPAATSSAPPTSSPTTSSVPASAATASASTQRRTAPAHSRVSARTAATAGAFAPVPLSYTGIWNDTDVTLNPVEPAAAPPTTGVAGALTVFVTNDPADACLTADGGPTVYAVSGDPNEFLARVSAPADCTTADFVFTTS
ncbi:MAG TPA: glycosyl hydrolase family 18 protein [Acidimicrobiales bacterium]